jgi:LPS export ABC transporter protein LptC
MTPARRATGFAALAAAGLLAACGAGTRGVASVASAADSADQVIMGMRTNLTKDGVRQAYLRADTAFVYETGGHSDLRHVQVTFFSPEGVQQSVLTALEGTYWMRTNQMSAHGDVVVVRTSDGARLRTDFLQYDAAKGEVSTDKAYVADKGTQHFEGDGFVCDPGFTNCSTQHARGTAGRLVMPGQ